MKLLIEVPKRIHEQLSALLVKGEYEDLNQFVLVAVENQIRAESGEEDPWEVSAPVLEAETKTPLPLKGTLPVNGLLVRPFSYPIVSDHPISSEFPSRPLWGQLYKFLPSKVGLRVLANMSKTGPPSLNQFRTTAAEIATGFRRVLVNMDRKLGRKFGEELSTSFPSNNDKSRKRFMDQYLIYFRSSNAKIDGLPARMGWLNVIKDGRSISVGITKSGYEFAKLENPIIDHQGVEPLSSEEKDFILNHILATHRGEALHTALVLRAISSGVASREQLNQAMAVAYREHWNDAESWSPAVINTMRSGIISRLFELGLIEKQKTGVKVTYLVTAEGLMWLGRLGSRFEPLEVKTSG